MTAISSVLRRSNQGVTHPFICIDESDRKLWVKGSAWSKTDLASEWICALLAHEWGLPIAHFELVNVSDDLIQLSAIPDIASLGSGTGFGSYHVDYAAELNWDRISSIEEETQADILLFDYWIQNDDRILGEQGGNPNMLWQDREKSVTIIDHNNAFSREFDTKSFFADHAFAQARTFWNHDFRESRQQKMLGILEKIPDILTSVPDEWYENDDVLNWPLNKEIERMAHVLRRIESETEQFWEATP